MMVHVSDIAYSREQFEILVEEVATCYIYTG